MFIALPAVGLAIAATSYYVTKQNASPTNTKDELIYEGYGAEGMRALVPACGLLRGAIRIEPKNPTISHLTQWSDDQNEEAFDFIQKIDKAWNRAGIGTLVYGKESSEGSARFGWEVVPYPRTNVLMRVWTQIHFLWNTVFGGVCLSQKDLKAIAEQFKANVKLNQPLDETEDKYAADSKIKCAFCKDDVINGQTVFTGKTVRVIYPDAPLMIGKNGLHLLVVSKEHAPRVSRLSKDEYREVSDLSKKLICHFQKKGLKTVYIYNKSGKNAGQTVPHFHQHLVFTATKADEFWGKLTVLKNILFGSSKIKEKLAPEVKKLTEELANLDQEKCE